VPIATALAAATSRPASALGLAGHGRLAAGARADLVWFTDNLDVLQVWTAGLCKTPPRPARGTEAARPGLENLEERGTLAIVQEFLAQEASAQRALAAVAADLAALADAVAERLRAGGRLFYAGAGTSGRLGLLDAVECGPTFGIPEGVIIPILAGGAGAFLNAVEGAEDDAAAAAAALAEHGVGPGDALVAIAASGATPFTLAALRHAARQGALTGAITNSPGSPLAAAAQFPVAIASGAEIIAGSTRLSAGTTQKIALNVLSSTVMIALGKTYGPYMVDLRATNAKLRRRAAAMTAKLAGVDETQARLALEACNMHVKTAIVMLRLGLSAQSAAQHLESADFSLRRALKTSH
jgi:N-acetylmuramic acid 6-phosphate etherase